MQLFGSHVRYLGNIVISSFRFPKVKQPLCGEVEKIVFGLIVFISAQDLQKRGKVQNTMLNLGDTNKLVILACCLIFLRAV